MFLQLLLRQVAAEVQKLPCFLGARRSSYHMANQAANDVGLVRFKLERVHQAAGDGGEGVAVEIAEGCKAMALLA